MFCKRRLTPMAAKRMIGILSCKEAHMQKNVGKARGMLLLIFVNIMWGLSFIFS